MDTQSDGIPSASGDRKIELEDDLELLDMMLADSKSQLPLYQQGPYWAVKARNAANEMQRCGIADFRGSTNLIGQSYADNLHIDVRNAYNRGLKRFIRRLTKMYPLSRIFEAQVRWTESYARESIACTQEVLNAKERTRELLEKYTIPYSCLGGCLKKAEIDGRVYSTHYLNLLEQHDNVASRIRFADAHSIFEIGGGFGTNVHLLLENYENIRKVLYLDIPPNLYVGTQYLKAFYGAAVSDYRALRRLDSIGFSADESMEIYCIAPWQIEEFEGVVDIFMNSHSFVEMPNHVVGNYAEKVNGLHGSRDTAIALTTYDGFDLRTTLDPDELPKYFGDRKFESFKADSLLDSSRKNLYFVSPGKLSVQ